MDNGVWTAIVALLSSLVGGAVSAAGAYLVMRREGQREETMRLRARLDDAMVVLETSTRRAASFAEKGTVDWPSTEAISDALITVKYRSNVIDSLLSDEITEAWKALHRIVDDKASYQVDTRELLNLFIKLGVMTAEWLQSPEYFAALPTRDFADFPH